MSFEYSSIKIPKLFTSKNMFGGAEEIKSIDNIVLPDKGTLTTTLFIIMYILLAIVIIIVLYNYLFPMKEGMSGGTLTQLFAQDSQNAYLNSAEPKIQSGNFKLFWNQPTRVSQRGVPTTSTISEISNNLPQTNMNPGYKPTKKQESLDEMAVDAGLIVPCENSCSTQDPTQCGNSHGNICRMQSGFVEPADDKPKPFVGLDGNIVYTENSGYVGSMWLEPLPNVRKPLPYIKPMDPPLSYVKEGYE